MFSHVCLMFLRICYARCCQCRMKADKIKKAIDTHTHTPGKWRRAMNGPELFVYTNWWRYWAQNSIVNVQKTVCTPPGTPLEPDAIAFHYSIRYKWLKTLFYYPSTQMVETGMRHRNPVFIHLVDELNHPNSSQRWLSSLNSILNLTATHNILCACHYDLRTHIWNALTPACARLFTKAIIFH